jgi:hypothetical protein
MAGLRSGTCSGIVSDRAFRCQRDGDSRAPRIMVAMFIAVWEGTPPSDRAEWFGIMREVLAGELGSYRIVFARGKDGWRFRLDWWEGESSGDDAVIANGPESVAYNLYVNLSAHGKPMDPDWRPPATR